MISSKADYSAYSLKKSLNATAEPSGLEVKTHNLIAEYLKSLNPVLLETNIGGYSLLAVLGSGKKTIIFRSDTDAVRTGENVYRHVCGHDGHSAIGYELGRLFTESDINDRMRLVLFFQASEENGKGCLKAFEAGVFNAFDPFCVLSLHNIPGYPLGSVIIREGSFSSASCGLRIFVKGKASHACSPNDGISPVIPMLELVNMITALADKKYGELATIVHLKAGEEEFGITPSDALISVTLRARDDDSLLNLKDRIIHLADKIIVSYGLVLKKTETTELFPAVFNDSSLVSTIKKVASEKSMNVFQPVKPFLWSEDFGHLSQRFKGVMFGLGNGEKSAGLHEESYLFSEELITEGSLFLMDVIRRIISED